jgi:hypothetical protein
VGNIGDGQGNPGVFHPETLLIVPIKNKKHTGVCRKAFAEHQTARAGLHGIGYLHGKIPAAKIQGNGFKFWRSPAAAEELEQYAEKNSRAVFHMGDCNNFRRGWQGGGEGSNEELGQKYCAGFGWGRVLPEKNGGVSRNFLVFAFVSNIFGA